ncbi:LacI family transcriptional regulator [Caldibacillus lycopersici]|uniref:LacI family transcriptional regulator n=1 Tax=Perspicuibacillus lycopersici TaxID=1325689 RepID=A0AAE3IUN2_9BACI|nr:LacI family DNA-binding transcriptional regulator [Perspicuibacillus lycopersici]MCU9613169.1 LacI family transcriptional regulator [Perspicuibacillus lycopersici]
MVTLKDLARITGYSVTTVSRALNGYDDVNKETRDIILAAAEKLEYTPNINAQSLVTKRSKTIGFLVSDLKRESAKDNFTFEVLCGISEFVTEAGYEMILLSTSSSKQKNKTFRQIVSERNLEGIIIQGLKKEDPYLQEAIKGSVPTVLVDIPIENETTGYVTSNQHDSVKKAIKYLARLGHRNIAYMNGHKHAYVSEIRYQSYKEGLSEAGLEVDENLVCYGDYEEEKAYRASLDFLLSNPEVTAFFCASDIMALGVLKAAKELKLDVPKDLSIIGFDNILLTQYTSPTLSTIGQKPFELGKRGTELLLEIIQNSSTQRHIIIQNELILRESTAQPGG